MLKFYGIVNECGLFVDFKKEKSPVTQDQVLLNSFQSKDDIEWLSLSKGYTENIIEKLNEAGNREYWEDFKIHSLNLEIKNSVNECKTDDFVRTQYLGGHITKINCIKEIKNMTGFGLKEAKDYVESFDTNIKNFLNG